MQSRCLIRFSTECRNTALNEHLDCIHHTNITYLIRTRGWWGQKWYQMSTRLLKVYQATPHSASCISSVFFMYSRIYNEIFYRCPQNPHCPRLEVSAGVSTSWGVGDCSLKVDDAAGVYWRVKGKGAAVLNHKPTKVLRLSMNNPVSSRKPDMWSLHQ